MAIVQTRNRNNIIISVRSLVIQVVRWSRLLFTPVAIVALAYFLINNYESIIEIALTANLRYVLISASLWCIVNMALPLVTYQLLAPSEQEITITKASCIHLHRLPAKYIPGGIWHTVARSVDYARAGVDRRNLFNVLVLEHVLALVITAGIGGAGVYLYSHDIYWAYIGLVLGTSALLTLLAATLILFFKVQRANRRYYVVAFIIDLSIWMIASLSFLAYYYAFDFANLDNSTAYITSGYLFSWALGFISFFTPQGFGVFEVVISDLLIGHYSVASGAFIFIGFRFAILFSDLFVYLGYLILQKAVSTS